MAKKPKFYVVWEGHKPGIYTSWAECQRQIRGYANAKFRSFKTRNEAEQAFAHPATVKPAKKKPMYYVVWRGVRPGIYTSWDEARKQLTGVAKPQYKSFGSKDLARKAFLEGPDNYMGRSFKGTRDLTEEEKKRIGEPNMMSISVDAACNGKTGEFEYQGVITDSGTQLFHAGPYQDGTNNVGEFLALVHALAYLKKERSDIPIYSDSRISMGWVKKGRANSTAKHPKTVQLIKRAEKWLAENEWKNPILKWETKAWGDIPADFNRK